MSLVVPILGHDDYREWECLQDSLNDRFKKMTFLINEGIVKQNRTHKLSDKKIDDLYYQATEGN